LAQAAGRRAPSSANSPCSVVPKKAKAPDDEGEEPQHRQAECDRERQPRPPADQVRDRQQDERDERAGEEEQEQIDEQPQSVGGGERGEDHDRRPEHPALQIVPRQRPVRRLLLEEIGLFDEVGHGFHNPHASPSFRLKEQKCPSNGAPTEDFAALSPRRLSRGARLCSLTPANGER
jgi:hypothetical protein